MLAPSSPRSVAKSEEKSLRERDGRGENPRKDRGERHIDQRVIDEKSNAPHAIARDREPNADGQHQEEETDSVVACSPVAAKPTPQVRAPNARLCARNELR